MQICPNAPWASSYGPLPLSLPGSASSLPVFLNTSGAYKPPNLVFLPRSRNAPFVPPRAGQQEATRRRSSIHSGAGRDNLNDRGPHLCGAGEQETQTKQKDRLRPSSAKGDKLRETAEAFAVVRCRCYDRIGQSPSFHRTQDCSQDPTADNGSGGAGLGERPEVFPVLLGRGLCCLRTWSFSR